MARTKDFDEAEVLGKAICIFWHKGYNGTSMQDLVDGLGISRSSLYDTFTDKYSLYVKALESYQQKADAQLCAIIRNHGSAKEAIRQLLEMTVADLLKDREHKGCFMVNAEIEMAAHDDSVREMVNSAVQQMEKAFYQAIVKGQKSGELSTRHRPKALARMISNTVKGLQVSAKSTKERSYFDDVIRTTLALLD